MSTENLLPMAYVVLGHPVGQPRATPVRRGKRAWMIEAPSTHGIHSWKQTVREAVQGAEPYPEGLPLRLWLSFKFSRPQRILNKEPEAVLPHVVKPDCDNLAKAVQDCLNGILWHDDRQIAKLIVDKSYCRLGEVEGVLIEVSPLTIN